MIIITEPLYFEASRLQSVLTERKISAALGGMSSSSHLSFFRYKETIWTMEVQSKRTSFDCLSFIFLSFRLRWTAVCIQLKAAGYVNTTEECAILNEGLSGFPYQYQYTARPGQKSLVVLRKRGSDEPLSGWILLKQSVFSQSLFEEDTCQQMKL